MDPFVSIVNISLVYNRSRDGTNSSIYETKAVFNGCSSVVDCICVSTQGSRVHNCVIPPANSVPINVVNPDHDFVVDHAEFCHRSSKHRNHVPITAQICAQISSVQCTRLQFYRKLIHCNI